MPFGYRKSIPLLGRLVRLNASKSGLSATVKVGPWSWNTRQRRHRVDLPGPTYWQSRRQRGPSSVSAFLRLFAVIGVIGGVLVAGLAYAMWTSTGPADLVTQARDWLGV